MAFSPTALQPLLQGVFGFPVTPFLRDLRINLPALSRHVDWMCDTGVDAIFCCAGTGEFFSLEPAEYGDAVAAAVQAAGGRLPVLAGCGYGGALARQFARAAEDAGAAGLLLLPHYLLNVEQEGLYRHARAVAESTPLPVILYHRDNALYSVRTVERLAALPNIIGFKDGHGNLEHFGRLVVSLGDRLAYMNGMPTAEMTFLSYYAAGCEGYSSALSNFAPQVTLRFNVAVRAGDLPEARKILRQVIEPICRLRDQARGFAVSYVKAAVNLSGLLGASGAGPVRPPLVDLDPAQLEELQRILETIEQNYPGGEISDPEA